MTSHKYVENIVLISEMTNDAVFFSTAGLCDDPSEGIVVGTPSVLRLQEGLCGEQHQSVCLVQPPRQPLTDAMNC
jgi:hypothetical protein